MQIRGEVFRTRVVVRTRSRENTRPAMKLGGYWDSLGLYTYLGFIIELFIAYCFVSGALFDWLCTLHAPIMEILLDFTLIVIRPHWR